MNPLFEGVIIGALTGIILLGLAACWFGLMVALVISAVQFSGRDFFKIAGVIATNTTISREDLQSENKTETGGLSGKPLAKRSTEVIRFLSEKSNKAFSIIGVGGIHSPEDAIEKLDAGASLIQLYTGFIYEGPALVKAINKKIVERV